MKTIYKYPFRIQDEQMLAMPEGAQILSVQMQGTIPTIWALVASEAPLKPRKIEVYGTGHEIVDLNSLQYLGTVQERGFVWHIFERATR
jgi:hypothetical protein